MRLLAFLIALLSFTGSASAFHEIESFGRTQQGGGDGNFFTGSSRFKGYDCRICHTDTEGKISIGMEVNRPELLQGQYQANTGYAITLKLVGEHRGLESAFNPNTFMLELVNDQGEPVGEYLPGPAPVELVDEGRVLAAEGFGEGESEWNFTWFSPRDPTGAITLHLAMLDGDGAGEPELRWIDPLHDDVATMTLRLCPVDESCPKPASAAETQSAVHCGVAGTNASPRSMLLWLLMASMLLAPKRAGPSGLLALLLCALACASPASHTPRATKAAAPDAVPDRHSGFRLTYALPPRPAMSEQAREEALERVLPILASRLEALRLDRPLVRRVEDEIVVELAEKDQEALDQVRRVLPQAGLLEFRLVRTGSDFMKNLCDSVATDSRAHVMKIETGLDVWQGADGSTVKECYLSAVDRTAMLNSEEASAEGCKSRGDTERSPCVVSGRHILERYLDELKLEVGTQLLFERGESSALQDESGERFWRSYYLHEEVSLRAQMVQNAQVQVSKLSSDAQLLLELSEEGAHLLEELTRARVGHKLAIVLDGRIESAPVIREAIAKGQLMLHLGPDSKRASEVAAALRGGALPAPLVEVSAAFF